MPFKKSQILPCAGLWHKRLQDFGFEAFFMGHILDGSAFGCSAGSGHRSRLLPHQQVAAPFRAVQVPDARSTRDDPYAASFAVISLG